MNKTTFLAILFAVGATLDGPAAVTLNDVTSENGVITIGADTSFPTYEGWIPWLKPYSGDKDWGTDQKAVIWQNRKLSEIKALRCKMSGSWFGGNVFVGHALIISRTDEKMEVQFQTQDGGFCKAVLAYLEQDGDNIVGWGRNAGYVQSSVGLPVPYSNFNLQVSSTTSNGAYGVYDIEVLNVLEATPAELKAVAATVGESGTDTLEVNEGTLALKPTQTNDVFDLNITGNANVYFVKGDSELELEALSDGILTTDARTILPGYSLSNVELVSTKSGGSWMGVDDAQIYHLQKETGKLTFQAQKIASGWTQCVLVELTDTSAGVAARIVWGRYKDNWDCPVGTDFSTLESYNTYVTNPSDMRSTLSSLILRVPPSIVFASSKSSWTTWGTFFECPVRVTSAPLAANSRNFVLNGSVLRLEAAAGNYNGGDSRHYEVGNDSELILAEQMSITDGGSVTLDGGRLLALNGFLYVNNLTITNGGSFVGSTTARAGYHRDVVWNIDGTAPVVIEPGIELVANWRTVTLKTDAPTTIVGSLKDASGYAGATFAKDGAATLTLGSENYNSGPFKVLAGELVLANPKGIKAQNAVSLGGGGVLALSSGNVGVEAGALTMAGDGTLDARNGTFSFADSSAAEWTGNLKIIAASRPYSKRVRRLRFGTDANGLRADQLARISYDESVGVTNAKFRLDDDGWLVDDARVGLVITIR